MDLGTDNIPSLFKKFFIPTLFGMLSICSVVAVDGVFVGHGVGSDGIAAINICVPLLMIFTGLGLMTGIGSSVIASIALSRGKIKLARLNITQSLLFVTILTALLSALIMAFPEQTAYLLGSSQHLMPLVREYLLWFVPSLTFQMWLSVSLFIIRLDGSPKLAMWCNILAAAVNTVLVWLFIFPFGWGIQGSASAGTVSIVIGGTIALSYLLFYAKTLRLYPMRLGIRGFRLFWQDITGQCRIGSSALMGEAAMAVMMFVGNHVFMQHLGDDGVGAFGICCYYAPFVFMMGNAIAQSAQPVISYNYGLNNAERTASAEKTALCTAFACGTLVSAVFIFAPEFMVSLFLKTDNPAARIAINGFPYFATGFICFIFNLTVIGYFQSTEKLKPAVFFALLRGLIFLVPAFLLLPHALETKGIWLAMPLSETLTAVSVILFYLIGTTAPHRGLSQPEHS